MNGQPYEPPRAGDDDVTGFDIVMFVVAAPVLVAWWLARHWPVTVPVTVAVAVWVRAGLGVLLITAVATGLGCAGWWFGHQSSFSRWVVEPYRRRYRRFRYRRVWTTMMHNAGLTRGFGSERVAPSIVRMRLGYYTDRLLVQLLVGQSIDEIRSSVAALGDTFDALTCTVTPAGNTAGRLSRKTGRVWVEVTIRDRLADVVPPIQPAEQVDLSRLTIGKRVDDSPWTVSLQGGSHLLIGGATGAGKSSVLWSIINAIGPNIRDGLVQVWAADPKGGMELALGADLFTRFTYGPDMVDMVADTAQLIEDRATRYRGHIRQHVPTAEDPHIVVILDELARLTAYSDRDAVKRLEKALAVVVSQGRAVGVTVIGAAQDLRKHVVDLRGMFPTRIALRVAESTDVGLILSDGAHARGAECEHIPHHLRGVGYVETDDDPDPVRVRASYYDDDAVRTLAQQYRPRPATTGPRSGDPDVIVGEILGEAA